MGRMSAAVAHEIRNPLAAIVQANALLEEDLQDPQHKRLADMVRQNAERLARITEEVLDIARVQHQLIHTSAYTLVLDEAIAQICSDWAAQDPLLRKPIVALQATSQQVEFDPDHLRRVMVNLMDNALRYMRSDHESLIISTRSNNGQISVQVWSDGAPLDKSVERHLFEPFFSSESRSSGLGLYICRELCQRHGASISYARLHMERSDGQTSGNAFTVQFRRTNRPAVAVSLFDTIVV
jgi:two-component system sensor histidine kinase PilS (NtrC family)